jgi:flagellar basal body-associated protein FliL
MNFVLFFSILLVVVIVLFCVAIAVACVRVAASDKDEYYRLKKSEENQKENKG